MRLSRLPLLLLGLSLPVQAAQWSVDPRLSLRTGYNDNIRLTPERQDTILETSLTAAANLGVATENSGIFSTLGASSVRYSGGSGSLSSSNLDRENARLDTNAYYQNERNVLSGNLGVLRDSTLDSELDETGIVQDSRATRLRTTLSASWLYFINSGTQMNLGLSATTVDYSGDTGDNDLVESEFNSFSASLSHRFTALTQGTVSGTYSKFMPDTGFDSETINLQAGLTRTFSETLSTSWLAGTRRTTSDILIANGFCIGADPGATFPTCSGGIPILTGTTNDEIENTGTVFSLSINKALDDGQLSATASRSANPGGDGELLETTRLSLDGEHRYSERLRSTLSLSYINSESIFNTTGTGSTIGTSSVRDNDLFRVRSALIWQWRKEVTISADYIYSEDKPAEGDTATGNAIFLTLSYQPRKISIAR